MNKIDEKTLALEIEKFEGTGLKEYFRAVIALWLDTNRRACETITDVPLLYRNQGMVEADRYCLKLIEDPLFFFKLFKDQLAGKAKGSGDLK